MSIKYDTTFIEKSRAQEKITELHTSLLRASNLIVVGLNETLVAIRARKAAYVIIPKSKHVNVYDY